jgi:hypothetical protein
MNKLGENEELNFDYNSNMNLSNIVVKLDKKLFNKLKENSF